MSQEICSSVDLIEELRLRRWARENYVPLQARSESLHPIILDEMCCRDGELEDSASDLFASSIHAFWIWQQSNNPNAVRHDLDVAERYVGLCSLSGTPIPGGDGFPIGP